MKKFLTFLLLFTAVAVPVVASAQVNPGEIPGPIGEPVSGEFTTISGLAGILLRIVGWVYTILFIVAVLFILFSAYNFITSKGDPDKVKTAKSQLVYAAIGIAVGLLAYAVVALVRSSLTGGL